MALMAAPRTPMRRRQRSVRVTVAVSLLSVATAIVLVSRLPPVGRLARGRLGSRPRSRVGRPAHDVDRGAPGASRATPPTVPRPPRPTATCSPPAPPSMRRSATAMTERLAQAHLAQRELEGLIVQHETRAQRAETKLAAETEALGEARFRVESLEQALVALQDDGSVVDLVAWDEQAAQKGRKGRSLKQA